MTDLLTENARLRAGPQIAGYTCKGCVHLRSEYWAEPDGEGGMDSGTSAACAHGEGRHISTYYGTKPPVPDWCPLPENEACVALTTPAPDAPCCRPQDITDQELQEFGIMDRILPVGGLGPKQEPIKRYAPDAVQEAARVERVACAMWKAEADRAAPNVGRNRTPEMFANELHDTRAKWLGLADAALRAIAGDRT